MSTIHRRRTGLLLRTAAIVVRTSCSSVTTHDRMWKVSSVKPLSSCIHPESQLQCFDDTSSTDRSPSPSGRRGGSGKQFWCVCHEARSCHGVDRGGGSPKTIGRRTCLALTTTKYKDGDVAHDDFSPSQSNHHHHFFSSSTENNLSFALLSPSLFIWLYKTFGLNTFTVLIVHSE